MTLTPVIFSLIFLFILSKSVCCFARRGIAFLLIKKAKKRMTTMIPMMLIAKPVSFEKVRTNPAIAMKGAGKSISTDEEKASWIFVTSLVFLLIIEAGPKSLNLSIDRFCAF